jgi:uncharacterized coiled-coil protein SlyX
MKIYQTEIKDGLENQLNNNNLTFCSVAQSCALSEEVKEKIIASSDLTSMFSSAQNSDQIDLFYLQSILVSTGWNKNDDVFDPTETWDARNTPEDKPFNFMHNEKDIIGHITGNAVVDFDGNKIDEDSENPPSSFNIITNAVIYKSWSDIEQRERINKIIAEIEKGEWYVSMECLFPAFDYALLNDDGQTKVVQRNEASAFLTKHLRAYGGDGLYENYRIGRLLRNLAFSGKGLVSKPANPRSIILDKNDFFDESKSQNLTISSIKEMNMSDLDKQVEDLRAELAEAKAANEALKEKVVAEQQAEFESKIQELEATIAEQAKNLEAKDATIAEQAEAIKNGEKDMKDKMEELREMKKKEAMMKRKAQLEEAGLDAEEASATVESFDGVTDEAFEAVVAVMKKKYAKEHDDKKEEEKDAKAEIEEELDPAEASEDVLEEAEASEEVAISEVEPEVDPAESLRAAASEWIGSFLQSTPKNK